ncbi:MAG: septum formation initiator family protein [Desulfotomaculum sp.]|nr:septum formation initiator family protein [Desulfotomaculum sp.]
MISSNNGRRKTTAFNKAGKIKYTAAPRRKSRLRVKFPILVFALVFGYLVISLSGEINKLNAMRHSVTELEQEIEILQNRNEELHKMLKSMESKEYIEHVAREKLGLVKPGESLIVPVEEQGEKEGYKIRDHNIKD